MKLTSDSIDQFLGSMYENGRSENSVRAYRSDLECLWKFIVMENLNPSLVEQSAAQYLTGLRLTSAPRTIQRKLSAFKAWAKYHGQVDFLVNYKAPTPAKPTPHPLPEGQQGVLIMYGYANTPHHKALVVLCGLMGCRVGEARKVRVQDFDVTGMTLLIRGKGEKHRVIPYGETAWSLIQGPLLVAQERDGEAALLVPLSDRGARAYYKRLARRALDRDSSTHDMRATAATTFYDRTLDLRAVQELLGHASNKTTEVYTKVSEKAMRKAVS